MTEQRLTEQLQLAFTWADASVSTVVGGAESVVAKREPERPAVTNSLMEAVCERDNLKKALRRVKANKGSPGIDGMTVEQFPDYLRAHWPEHREELLQGRYTPSPVRRVEIPKPDGGVRKLGVPTVLDRFVQQAVLQVVQPIFDPTFSDHSYGFRPGRSAHQAVAAAQEHLASGYRWVVDLDLEKFFDRVNHDILMSRLAQRVTDPRVLKLVRTFLSAGVLENGLVSATEEGTPQGGPLSPLLSNIVLHALDCELEGRGHRFVRSICGRLQCLRPQRASGASSDGEHHALHHDAAEAQGQRGEKRGRDRTGADVSGLRLYSRPTTQTATRRQLVGPVSSTGPEADQTGARCEPAPDGEGTDRVLVGVAGVLRLLRDADDSPTPGQMGPAAASRRRLETVGATWHTLPSAAEARRQRQGRHPHGSQQSRAMAGDVDEGAVLGASRCLLRLARIALSGACVMA
jgi:retron-type reverse transcriptase